jgi:hypothetical protein
MRLEAVRSLTVAKPSETRHAHLRPLPLEKLKHITHLQTSNLCLAEIDYLLHQIIGTKSELHSIICRNIETWCFTRLFDFDLILMHPSLRRIQYHFLDDGRFGYASIHNSTNLKGNSLSETIRSFSLTSIRDSECMQQLNLLKSMEDFENGRDEDYDQQDINMIEKRKSDLLESWYVLEIFMLSKYKILSDLRDLEHFEYGFCYAWTPDVWRDCFGKVLAASPALNSLGLHGWDQLGKLVKAGSKSSTIQPIRADAEFAIAECFENLTDLRHLKLVDFSIGPGLIRAGKSISKSVQYIEIIFSNTFVPYLAESADVWLLMGPVKEFIVSAFSNKDTTLKRHVDIRLHPDLIDAIRRNEFFIEQPFLKSIKTSLEGFNVQVTLQNDVPSSFL